MSALNDWFSLAGRRAVVTGGSSGVGQAIDCQTLALDLGRTKSLPDA